MASNHNSSEEVEKLAALYGESVLAVEESYPGIFMEKNSKDNFLGEVDLLVRKDENRLKAYEVKESSSLNQRTLISQAREAKKQLINLEVYFETFGYELDTEYLIIPKEHLRSAYEVWRDLPDKFTAEQVKHVLSEPGRFSHVKDEALNEKEDGIYELDSSLKSLMDSGVIQP